jgi:transcriptional regulator with XRE-family HTH domain
MRQEFRGKARGDLDREMRWMHLALWTTPPLGGWLRRVRKAMGVKATDLAGKLEIDPSVAFNLERSEREGTITQWRLRQMAQAMDCRLVYGIAPREGRSRSWRWIDWDKRSSRTHTGWRRGEGVVSCQWPMAGGKGARDSEQGD